MCFCTSGTEAKAMSLGLELPLCDVPFRTLKEQPLLLFIFYFYDPQLCSVAHNSLGLYSLSWPYACGNPPASKS